MSKRRSYPSSHNPEARLTAIEQRGESLRRRRVGLTSGLAAIVVVLIGLGSMQLFGSNNSDTMVVAAPGDDANNSAPADSPTESAEPAGPAEQTTQPPVGLSVGWDTAATTDTLTVVLNTPDFGTDPMHQHCVQLGVYAVGPELQENGEPVKQHAYSASVCRNIQGTAETTVVDPSGLVVRPSHGVELGCAVSIERGPTTQTDDSSSTIGAESPETTSSLTTDPVTQFDFDISTIDAGAYEVHIHGGAGLIRDCALPMPGDSAERQHFNEQSLLTLP